MGAIAERDTYLFECSPFDPVGGATVDLRWSTEKWSTDASETPASKIYYGGLDLGGFGFNAINVEAGLLGGFVEPGQGQASIATIDNTGPNAPNYQRMVRYEWTGYPFVVYKIKAGDSHADRAVYLKGFVSGVNAGEASANLTLTSLGSQLSERPIYDKRFWGRKHALRFVTGNAHYVDMGDNQDQTGAFCMEVLVRTRDGTPAAQARIFRKADGSTGWSLSQQVTNGNIVFGITNASKSFSCSTSSPLGTGLTDETWTMISAVWDPDNGRARIYFDGVLAGELTGLDSSYNPIANAATLYVGAKDNAGTEVFGGDIAEYRVWNYARTQQQIQDGLYAPWDGIPAGLVGYFEFGSGTGSTLGDSAEVAHDGTISGATWIGTYEGERSLAGQVKPWAVGSRYYVEPVLIDSAKLIYAVCDRGFADSPSGEFPLGRPRVFDGGNEIFEDDTSGSGSAPLTLWLQGTGTAPGSSHGEMDEVDPGGSTLTGFGWVPNTLAGGKYSLLQWGSKRAAGTFGSTALPNAAPSTNDCIRSTSTYTGRFQAGTWTFHFSFRNDPGGSSSTMDGRCRLRIWRSVNVDMSSATEITTGAQDSNIEYDIDNNGSVVQVSVSVAETDLSSEYLAVQVAWKTEGAGDDASDEINIRFGSSRTRLVTAPFNPGGGTPETDLWLTTVNAGDFKYDATLGLVRLGTAPSLRGSVSFCSATYDGLSTALPVGQLRAIVEESGGFTSSDTSLSDADFGDAAVVESGVYVKAGGVKCSEVLTSALSNYTASGGFNQSGIFKARSYIASVYQEMTPRFRYTEADVMEGTFQLIAVLQPIKEVQVKYRPYSPKHGPSEVASILGQAALADLTREYRQTFKSRPLDRFGSKWSNYNDGARSIVAQTSVATLDGVGVTIPGVLDLLDTRVRVVRFELAQKTVDKRPSIGDRVSMSYPAFEVDVEHSTTLALVNSSGDAQAINASGDRLLHGPADYGTEAIVVGYSEVPGGAVLVDIIDATTLTGG